MKNNTRRNQLNRRAEQTGWRGGANVEGRGALSLSLSLSHTHMHAHTAHYSAEVTATSAACTALPLQVDQSVLLPALMNYTSQDQNGARHKWRRLWRGREERQTWGPTGERVENEDKPKLMRMME